LAVTSGVAPCFAAWLVGVGNTEPAATLVGCANVGRSNNSPFRSEPVLGQRCEDLVERFSSVGSKDSWDVLQQKPAGVSSPSNFADVVDEPSVIVHSFAFPGRADRLAWEPCGHDVDRRRVGDLSQVAEVRHVRMVVGHNTGGVLVDFGVPGKVDVDAGHL
jgi:hypothetical protein